MIQIEKLPKWARVLIKDLSRERDTAVEALNRAVDGQSKSPIYYDDMLCIGEQAGPSTKRFYVQSSRLTIEHAGIECGIYLAPEGDGQRLFGIEIQFLNLNHRLGVYPALVPRSANTIQILTKENMR